MAHRFVLSVNYGQLLFETIAHKDLLSSGRELGKKRQLTHKIKHQINGFNFKRSYCALLSRGFTG